MNIVWLVIKFVIYTYLLVGLYSLTFLGLFIGLRRPITWMVTVGLIGVTNMVLAFLLNWDPRLVSAAVITAIILTMNPSPIYDNEFYKEELGISNGKLKVNIGLAIYILCSFSCYILFFSESCINGKCT